MNQHDLILLSPYKYPGQYALTLADEDMASWLNAYTALWHPAALWQAKGPPRVDSQYDHEQPQSGCLYVLPETPPLYLPDDWQEKVKAAGSVAFQATPDRAVTLANLKAALHGEGVPGLGWKEGFDVPEEELGIFFGVGLGYLLQASLSEAMEHDNLLEAGSFWDDVQSAVAARAGFTYEPTTTIPTYNPELAPRTEGYDDLPTSDVQEFNAPSQDPETASFEEFASPPHDDNLDHLTEPGLTGGDSTTEEPPDPPSQPEEEPVPFQQHLRRAAEKLLSAREVLYPVTIHLLDLYLLDEKTLADPWPASMLLGNSLNLLASGVLLEKLAQEQPEKLNALRERVQAVQVEVCGGLYREREDSLLPVDSQLWNLSKGKEVARQLLGTEVRVFARKRFGYHPQLPLLLTTSGITRCLMLTFEENSGLPTYQGVTISWPSPDGKQIDAFVRNPHPVESPQTFFNLGHHWFKTTREDHTATLALVHKDKPAAVWYHDLMHLARLAPVLGQWNTFTRYFNEVVSGEHVSSLGPDEFHFDYLSERTGSHLPGPVSDFARHLRWRRRLDTCWTLAALHRSLAGSRDTLNLRDQLQKLEEMIEQNAPAGPESLPDLDDLEKRIASTLAERLQARSAANQPGYLVLNPCSFTRRLALELEGGSRPLPIEGPVKGCQLDGNGLRAVVEVPPLGFAWIPREGPMGTPPPATRLRLADAQSLTLRNEFFEVDVDPQTGGLKAIRDHKTRLNRLGQRLVFNPGSQMQLKDAKVTSAGPALGEITSEGVLVGEQNQVLANYRQRFRVWLGRPVLEMRIELEPVQPPAGYPWHAYYGARFAWRDERAVLLRSAGGTGFVTSHPRPQTPDYLELRLGRQGTVLFPGGLPFHQRQEGRMLDVILIPEGEKATTFDLAIALDREQPMQTALGLTTPLVVVPTTKGPPHVGTTGWLFHLDAPHLLLSRLQPGALEVRNDGTEQAPEPRDAVTARFLECGGHTGQAEFRCVRDPRRAAVLDAQGNFLLEATLAGDTVFLEVTPNDLVQVQVEFS
jgi:hypothetical protein